MNDEKDIFWGRCSPKTEAEKAVFKPPFNEDPHWREDNTCSHCGGLRPSLALEKIRAGAEVIPTDKNYKIYVDGHTKCYLNHFSESQAVEFVLLNHQGKMKLAFPHKFYSGLCFGIYKDAIKKALAELPK